MLALILTLSANAQDFHPLAYAPAPVDNPLKGFVPYDTAGQNQKANFLHSLEWFYISLAELMPADLRSLMRARIWSCRPQSKKCGQYTQGTPGWVRM